MLTCLKTAVVLCRGFLFFIKCCRIKLDTAIISKSLLPKYLSLSRALKSHLYYVALLKKFFIIFLNFFQGTFTFIPQLLFLFSRRMKKL